MEEIGRLINQKRIRENLSLREAGSAMGLAFSTLARIEAGATPSLKAYHKIAAWLGGAEPILPPPPMTLRDWFAGQALVFINVDDASEVARKTGESTPDLVARLAYLLADALLVARQTTDREDGK